MPRLKITYVDPKNLHKNAWNPNVVDPVNQEKIVESIKKETFFRPILCRERNDGELEIIGGEHRVKAAVSMGIEEVPVVSLGRISDAEAKRKTLLDNSQYGDNDIDRMVRLLNDESIGSAEDLLAILPIDETELASFFESSTIDLDDLDIDLDNTDDIDLIDLDASKSSQTHQVMRFKVGIDDANFITDLITKTKHEQGYTGSDDLTNAGDSLVWILQSSKSE